ncbi:MAG: hypothetical protein IBX64_11865 [Actinobacteria bacterium]|nr:hypothetical protein [Actinomycetota bacterium]
MAKILGTDSRLKQERDLAIADARVLKSELEVYKVRDRVCEQQFEHLQKAYDALMREYRNLAKGVYR